MAMDFTSASLSPYLVIFLYLFIIAPQTLANCPPTPSKGPIAPLPPLLPTLPVPIPGLPSVPVPPVTVPPIIPPIDKPPVPLPPVVPTLPIPKIIPPTLPIPTLPIPKIIPPTLPIPKIIPPVLPSPPAPKSPCPPPPAPKPKPKPKPCKPCHPPALKCPVDTLKLGTCLEVLGATWHIGDPAVKCCPLIAGLTSVGAALCLCTAIKANALGLEVFVPIALELLVTCGKEAPPGYSCK